LYELLQDGKQFGDEYLAELDLIEVVEKQKDNYESDVEDSDDQQSRAGSSSVSDDYVPGDRDSDRSVAIQRDFLVQHFSLQINLYCTNQFV